MRTIALLFIGLAMAILVAAQDKKQDSTQKNPPQALQRSLSEAQKKREEVQRKIDKVDAQRKVVRRDIRSVDRDLTRVTSALESTSDKLDTSVSRQQELTGELEIASAKLTEQKTRVENRLRQIYRQPDHNVLTLLAGSESVGDFAERKELLQRIAERDREIFEGYKQLRAEIEDKRVEQQKLINQISDLKSQQEDRQN
ncbi:MAG TPA: hypothetical protein VNI20_00030, partial [Fimbriimonadaceae bacterium]|nr:hypothetical protein [Fimbriimonadaceae bacterium]